MKALLFFLPALVITNLLVAQPRALSAKQQGEDFEIFTGALKEGLPGLYYYISEERFESLSDSIRQTFREGSTVENFYLKLRLLLTSLRHGHTRISLPTNGNVNFKMSVLDTTKRYLPFQFLIQKDRLIVMEDCSEEQLIPRYAAVKSINNIPAGELIAKMLPYMPADGINQTFKNYSLYNYFYFHYLFNLFYPEVESVRLQMEHSRKAMAVQLLSPKRIEEIYLLKNNKSISQFGKPLAFNSNLEKGVAYLRVTSFFKGFIESQQQRYKSFLDSCFADLKKSGSQRLILDLRNNEGGGDNYENLLFSYLTDEPFVSNTDLSVAGRTFKYRKYADGSSEGFKMFVDNPNEFLRNDTSLFLKDEYAEKMSFTPNKDAFSGELYVLINGGTFSAATNLVRLLYNQRAKSGRSIQFIGEENGGDVYSQVVCSGQSYVLDLPNSRIKVDIPVICSGTLNKTYPANRLPDFEVYQTEESLRKGKDHVLQSALEIIKGKKSFME